MSCRHKREPKEESIIDVSEPETISPKRAEMCRNLATTTVATTTTTTLPTKNKVYEVEYDLYHRIVDCLRKSRSGPKVTYTDYSIEKINNQRVITYFLTSSQYLDLNCNRCQNRNNCKLATQIVEVNGHR